MNLSPRELDQLTLSTAGSLSQKRLARGLCLSYPEAISLLTFVLTEKCRDSTHSVSDLMSLGKRILGKNHVLPGVASRMNEVQVEAMFEDGVKLITVHDPICTDEGSIENALYGSFLPMPPEDAFSGRMEEDDEMVPGQVWTTGEDIVLNSDKDVVFVQVTNRGDRPIQVGSHYHFVECNPYLEMDRNLAYGRRLNICSGTAVRFEPSESKTVPLVSIGGNKLIRGGNGLCQSTESVTVGNAPTDILTKLQSLGFLHKEQPTEEADDKRIKLENSTISRTKYNHIFGPTVGDRVRLGDTSLVLQVEKDLISSNGKYYGDEVKFGGGKVIRDGMGQSSSQNGVDTVLTNALILDYSGIIKADIGITNGRICGIGKAGNPDTMDRVDILVGNHTEVIAAEGMIVTAGGIDAHAHFICPQLATVAICAGLTTLIGGGTGPASGTCATTCTPSPMHMKMMMQSTDSLPLNFGFTGKGNASDPQSLVEIIKAGACGLKLHEDWGTTPAAIDNCLSVAEEFDVQVNIHTDTLNESCMCEGSIAAFKGRTIHTYHTEGAGGGHAPDIIRVCGQSNVLPSSTNPTRPFTVNTVDEHLDMLMVCHHLDPTLKEDVSFAESRIRAETIAAEDILHDIGAISIMSSDSQAMGRIGEVITRTWQTAHKMKQVRGALPEDNDTNDNERIKRYIAKYTINPAITHGVSELIGSVEVNKLADLVLWNPACFGTKPQIILKSGYIAYAAMGDANASIPTPEPVLLRPMFAPSRDSYVFCSQASVDAISSTYHLTKHVYPVSKCRGLTKKDLKCNVALPKVEVDSETYQVKVDGEVLTCEPAEKVPLNRNYYMF